ncbi:hypothetical protein SDC9_49722 [bioreactor metagenome]|uniref:Uncharacterized protein n=1 Tax=bioreactor metagenome TaxID=1076179 RepID=A0A644WHV1_9ZZZZ
MPVEILQCVSKGYAEATEQRLHPAGQMELRLGNGYCSAPDILLLGFRHPDLNRHFAYLLSDAAKRFTRFHQAESLNRAEYITAQLAYARGILRKKYYIILVFCPNDGISLIYRKTVIGRRKSGTTTLPARSIRRLRPRKVRR